MSRDICHLKSKQEPCSTIRIKRTSYMMDVKYEDTQNYSGTSIYTCYEI